MDSRCPGQEQAVEPQVDAGTAGSSDRRRQPAPPDFFAAKYASLVRAGLGRFFGVAPRVTRKRTKPYGVPEQTGGGDNAETRQAKDIYQAMLDITGY